MFTRFLVYFVWRTTHGIYMGGDEIDSTARGRSAPHSLKPVATPDGGERGDGVRVGVEDRGHGTEGFLQKQPIT